MFTLLIKSHPLKYSHLRKRPSIYVWRPVPSHMLIDGEHTRCVVQPLTDVFADALKLAAASALGVFRFVADYDAWKCGGCDARLGW
ncbi:hypothetical protein D3C81_1969350 [compost metagenome]